MWATLALAAALQSAPAQTGAFALKNPRPTSGLLGQTRKDAKFLGGDMVFVGYELQNLKLSEDGIARYSLGIEVTTRAGKSIYKLEPEEFRAELSLGGNSRPASSFYEVPVDRAPGEYVLVITGTDLLAKASSKLEFPFEVLTPRLGFVQTGVNLPLETTLLPAAPTLPAGQTIVIGTGIVGFELGPKTEKDPKKQQPHVLLDVRILDTAGKPTLPKPKTGGVIRVEDPTRVKVIPFTVPLELNRPGKFKVVLTVTDKHANKTAEQTLELTVFESR